MLLSDKDYVLLLPTNRNVPSVGKFANVESCYKYLATLWLFLQQSCNIFVECKFVQMIKPLRSLMCIFT